MYTIIQHNGTFSLKHNSMLDALKLVIFYKFMESKLLISSKILLVGLRENQVKNVENVSNYILYVMK